MRPQTATRFCLVAPANAINATLYEKLNFNFIRDIAPVAGLVRFPYVMVVNPSVPAKTRSRIHRLCQGQPRQNQHGVGRQRQLRPMSGELFKMMTGVNMVHVPYRGAAPALTDLMGGQVQVMFEHPLSSHRVHQDRQAATRWR